MNGARSDSEDFVVTLSVRMKEGEEKRREGGGGGDFIFTAVQRAEGGVELSALDPSSCLSNRLCSSESVFTHFRNGLCLC